MGCRLIYADLQVRRMMEPNKKDDSPVTRLFAISETISNP